MRALAILGACITVTACPEPRRTPKDAMKDDAQIIAGDAEPWVPPDGPPPSVDAGPPPLVTCEVRPAEEAGMQCELPPSRCLDDYYLVYYTGGTCVDGTCEFQTHLMSCWGATCIEFGNGAGCNGGFT